MHLCVFIHGLWGNPQHLKIISEHLRGTSAEDEVVILLAKSNAGNYTYDGIETGAERVTHEIESEITSLEKDGKKIDKISMFGYSLGGLVARYVIGLLHSKGLFEKLTPVNFTTFATPHLGTRSPSKGWQADAFNALASSTLSASGQQLWALDSFRDTGRPLLAVMADPRSIFMVGLSKFKNRTLYANAVNDRAVPFYSAFVSDIDPFIDVTAVNIHYVPGYNNVIVDNDKFVTPDTEPKTAYEAFTAQSRHLVGRLPFFFFATFIAPIAASVYLGNAAVQSFQSATRIKQHQDGSAGVDPKNYHFPLLGEAFHKTAEAAMQHMSPAEGDQYLGDDDSAGSKESDPQAESNGEELAVSEQKTRRGFPILALTELQFEMIRNLDGLGLDKHIVYIHNANHSHAAIVIRMDRFGFDEGRTVFKHWRERIEV